MRLSRIESPRPVMRLTQPSRLSCRAMASTYQLNVTHGSPPLLLSPSACAAPPVTQPWSVTLPVPNTVVPPKPDETMAASVDAAEPETPTEPDATPDMSPSAVLSEPIHAGSNSSRRDMVKPLRLQRGAQTDRRPKDLPYLAPAG
jgi:hypothetical protein